MAVETQAPAAAAPSAPVAETSSSPDAQTPPVPGAPPAAAPEKLGSAYAKLAAQQKAAREAAEKVKSERVAFETERKAHTEALERVKAFEAAKAEAKRFPLKYLEQLGLTYQDVSEAQLSGGEPTPSLEVKAVRDELEQLRKSQEEKETKAIEAQKAALQRQQEQLVSSFRSKVEADVKAAGEKYEYVNAYGAHATVFNVIDAHANEQLRRGVPADKVKLLSIEEAAEAVEKDFEEQVEKARKTKKFSGAPKDETPAPQKPAVKHGVQPPTQAPTKTLSNNLTGSTSSTPQLSWKEREKRAEQRLREGRLAR